jgi:hypothetical protein
MNQCRLVSKESKVIEFLTPFDFAQGDRQTERSRSLISLTKRHYNMKGKSFKTKMPTQ